MTDVRIPTTPTDGGVAWADTRDMPWEPFGGFDLGRLKRLHLDADGAPLVMIVWLPPGDLGIELPHRHQHRTTFECAYQLGGDLPHAEWERPTDDHEIVVFREGFFMNRAPGSLHGNEWIFSDAGTHILMWRSGTGNWLDEPNATEETLLVDVDEPFIRRSWGDALTARWGDGIVLDRAGARIISTREMAWTALPEPRGAKMRVLAHDQAGEPSVRMVFIPPGQSAAPVLPNSGHDQEFAYVVEGELTVEHDGEATVCRPGYFMSRSPDAGPALVPIAPSPTGAVVLNWRIGPNTFAAPR